METTVKLDRGVAEVRAHKNTCTYCTQAPLESHHRRVFLFIILFLENEKKKRKIKLHSTIFRYFKLL